MDNENKTPAQRRAERQKYARIQRYIRLSAIALAIVLSVIALFQSCSTRKAIDDLAAQIRAKKIAQAQAELQALEDTQTTPSPTVSVPPADGASVTLSFVGDCTLGMDESDAYAGSFEEYYDSYGAPYFFQNVKSIFEGDDLTVANLEGTFTTSENRSDGDPTFKALPSHVTILAEGGIDAVSVANDHTHDYGNESYVDTLANLDIADIGRFGFDNVLTLTVGTSAATADTASSGSAWHRPTASWWDLPVRGCGTRRISSRSCKTFRISGMRAHRLSLSPSTGARKTRQAPDDPQIELAHQIIDAGADLIVGHHSQVLQGIELYHGKYIAYSLGTFISGGMSSGDMDTIIFQQTFTISGGKCLENAQLNIIPCSISAEAQRNTYCPTPAGGTEAQRILDKIYCPERRIGRRYPSAGIRRSIIRSFPLRMGRETLSPETTSYQTGAEQIAGSYHHQGRTGKQPEKY